MHSLVLRGTISKGLLYGIDGTVHSATELDRVRERYKGQLNQTAFPLSITYRCFESLTSKPRATTYRGLFCAQLQLVRAVDAEKAAAIVQIYPTLRALLRAYSLLETVGEKEELLANIVAGTGAQKKKLGIQASKRIYQLYCLDDYD